MSYEDELPINAVYYINNNNKKYNSDYNVFLNNYCAHFYTGSNIKLPYCNASLCPSVLNDFNNSLLKKKIKIR